MGASTFKKSFAGQTAVAVLMLTTCASALAVSTWNNLNLSSGCTPGTNAGAAVATCTPQAGSAGTLTLNGLSTNIAGTNTPTANFNSALIYDWGTTNGLGIVAGNENFSSTGPHAVDNKYGTDALLFNFSVATKLTSVKLGWNGNDDKASGKSYSDSDLSIFAWTGGAGGPTMANVGPDSLLNANSGWSLVGNFFNAGASADNTVATGSGVFSSYWLVSAYDSRYGGSDAGAGGRTGYDAFKVLAISANTCTGNTCPTTAGVPEPGSLALVGAAFMGLVASRRRLRKASA